MLVQSESSRKISILGGKIMNTLAGIAHVITEHVETRVRDRPINSTQPGHRLVFAVDG